MTSHVVQSSVYFATADIALLWLFLHLKCSVSSFVHFLHRVCVMAQVVGTMNQVEWEFLLCKWSSFRLSALLFRLD